MDETPPEGRSPSNPKPSAPAGGNGPAPLRQIRTFQGDIANALQNQKESLFSIQRSEQIKKAAGPLAEETSEEEGSRTLFFALGGVVLVLLGIWGAWLGYNEFLEKTAPPVISAPESRLISVQEELELNFASSTKEAVISFIKEKSTGAGTVKHFVMRQGSSKNAPLATTAEFLKKLETQASGSLVRAFDPLFMLGALGEHRFLIIKIISFENAFPGMLAWEKTMVSDIGDIFSTEDTLKATPGNPVFKDVVSKNKDVRVLTMNGTTTEPLLLYSFFGNGIVIVTENLDTFQTIVERLTQELLSR